MRPIAQPMIERLEDRQLLSGAGSMMGPCRGVVLGPPIPNPVATDGRLNDGSVPGEADGHYGAPRRGDTRAYTHQGLDITADLGMPVHSVEAGTVIRSGWSGRGGDRVMILNADGTRTSYMHLGPGMIPVGAQVEEGEVIGFVGRSGNVPAGARTHLHLQMYDGRDRLIVPNIDPSDPSSLLAPGFCIMNSTPSIPATFVNPGANAPYQPSNATPTSSFEPYLTFNENAPGKGH